MSAIYKLEAESRDRAGKGVARALRREDKIPAVVYGDNKEAVTITLPRNELHTQWHKGHMFTTICELQLGKDTHKVLARDVQLHPVKDTIMHVDFLRVTAKTKITVNVPVNFMNEEECIGLQEGGILSIVRFEVELLCTAVDIPDSIEVDLTSFNIGDSIKISDAVMPEGSTPVIDDRDFALAAIVMPRSAEEEEALIAEADADDGTDVPVEGEEDADGEDASAEDSAEDADKE